MILPIMPEGYWLKQEGHRWYVWKEDRPILRALECGEDGDSKIFYDPNDAALYAHRHKAAGLAYDQEVEEGNEAVEDDHILLALQARFPEYRFVFIDDKYVTIFPTHFTSEQAKASLKPVKEFISQLRAKS